MKRFMCCVIFFKVLLHTAELCQILVYFVPLYFYAWISMFYVSNLQTNLR